MSSTELLQKIQDCFGNDSKVALHNDEVTLEVTAAKLHETCKKLRDAKQFKFAQLIDLCGVDYLTYGSSEWATSTATSEGFSRAVECSKTNEHSGLKMPARFAVVYHLLSLDYNQRLRIKVFLHDDPPRLATVVDVWQSADWYEREAFDLFGILFDGHPDLRRILTDYGFIGHPFRKDFPLIGQVEMRYDAGAGRVLYEPVSIAPRTLVPKVIRYTGAADNVQPSTAGQT